MTQALRRPPKTIDDYLALPETVRGELIGGEIYVTPSPTMGHQDAAGAIYSLLRSWVRGHQGGQVFIAPLDVHLPSGDMVQPDVLLIAPEHRAIVGDVRIEGAPDLLVEVISTTHPERDRIVKRRLYAENGVAEYWLADPETATIEVFRLEGDVYRPAGYFQRGSALTSESLPGFRLSVDEVFERS